MYNRNTSKPAIGLSKLLIIFTLLISFTGLSHAAKYKIGVSVPSATSCSGATPRATSPSTTERARRFDRA